jgi:hypothetical protein
LPVVAGRRRAVTIFLCALLIVALVAPNAAAARQPEGIGRFMHAVGHVESGGRYHARNTRSGAYGMYQIMPSNWRAWARLYLGNAHARPTPRNQERVARAKFRALYHWLGSWQYVAHWWLTGSGSKHAAQWSPSSRRYVNRVMTIYRGKHRRHRTRVLQEGNRSIHYRGHWSSARYSSYAGGRVRYATSAGARASVTFRSNAVRWIGPKGPTRGTARVFVDGRYVRTVNLRSRSFDARAELFSRRWSKPGRHVLTIVVGHRGRPVAIDEIRIG